MEPHQALANADEVAVPDPRTGATAEPSSTASATTPTVVTPPGPPAEMVTPAGQRVDGRTVWTPERVRALGLTTDLTTAAHILGMGRTTAFELLRTGQFPVPVHRYGRRLVVPVAEILRLLGT